MTTTRADTRTRGARLLGAAVAVAVLSGVAALPASAAPPGGGGSPGPPPASSGHGPDPALSAVDTAVDPDAAEAMAAQFGITVAEATRRLGGQRGLAEKGASIEKSLPGRSGGSYLDGGGSLVVTTLDAAGDEVARRGGARAQRVDDSSARLEAVMRRLDRQAAQGGAGGLHGWYVDVPGNTVVVTVTEGASDPRTQAMLRTAAAFGDSVRIETAPAEQKPQPTAEYLVGGAQFVPPSGGTCSVGFNTRDWAGRDVVLTAGHCIRTTGTVSRNGYWIGNVRTTDFPGDDFGTFWNSYPNHWLPSASVTKYNGTFVNVRGQWNAPPVGATVCKSGRTTGYTCGSITAVNQTVVWKDGTTLYQLVRHNACVEPGDSGGSNISGAGAYALGVTSSAANTEIGKLCLSKVGSPNVSWYQPVGEALSRNGLTLLYQP